MTFQTIRAEIFQLIKEKEEQILKLNKEISILKYIHQNYVIADAQGRMHVDINTPSVNFFSAPQD